MFFRKIFKNNIVEDDWISFSRTGKRGKSFLKVNRAFSSFGAQRGYKYFLSVLIFLDKDLEKNHEILYEVEDKLSEQLEEKFSVILVGTEKTEKKYSIYFYSQTDKNALSETISIIMEQFPSVNFGISIEKDRSWKHYFENIVPSELESERCKNELTFYKLEKKYFGQEMTFFFFVSYRKKELFAHFREELQNIGGYDIVSEGSGKRKNFPYAVKISKKQAFRLEEIHNSVEILWKLSKKYSFIYEGWVLESKKVQDAKGDSKSHPE